MALDKEYFDAINIEVAKKKYYNANKVEAVLLDIRREADALNLENARLREQLEQLSGEKRAIGDVLISARTVARQIIADANKRADEILRDAETQRSAILAEAQTQESMAVSAVRDTVERLKARQLELVDQLNAEYQAFLCSLLPEEEPSEVPNDLSDKVSAIARELFEIGAK